MQFIKEMKKTFFISAVLYVILGIFLLFFPETSAKTICYAFAVILIIFGVGYLVSYFTKDLLENYLKNDLVTGLVTISIAIFIFIRVEIVLSLLPVILGLVVLISSIIKLQHAIDLFRIHYSGWWIILIVSLLSIALSILLLSDPFTAATTMVMVIGFVLIWSGLTDIFTGLFFIRKMKQLRQNK